MAITVTYEYNGDVIEVYIPAESSDWWSTKALESLIADGIHSAYFLKCDSFQHPTANPRDGVLTYQAHPAGEAALLRAGVQPQPKNEELPGYRLPVYRLPGSRSVHRRTA